MVNLKALAGKRWRVAVDESFEPGGAKRNKLWHYIIPGKRGHIHVHGAATLAVSVSSKYWIKRMMEIEGLVIHQLGDDEATFLFPTSLVDRVAAVIKARKRRVVSDEERARLTAQLARIRPPA